jgi:uncharacterized protein (DUF2236 family)
LLGGSAALLMQIAHPLVAAGVDQHSSFRRAPSHRLLRTINTALSVVFGDRAESTRAIARINGAHQVVTGVAADGTRYTARDPALLLWVQCTLVLTSLRFYELVMGRQPHRERQRYWEDGKLIAHELGIPHHLMPASIDDLERYEQRMLGSVVLPDETSCGLAAVVLRPYGWVPGPLWWPIDALTAGLLPPSLREAFGLRFELAERLLFRATIVALRMLVPMAPAFVRVVPHARR